MEDSTLSFSNSSCAFPIFIQAGRFRSRRAYGPLSFKHAGWWNKEKWTQKTNERGYAGGTDGENQVKETRGEEAKRREEEK